MVDRAAPQPCSLAGDLADAGDRDEHLAALNRDDEAVDAGGLGTEVDDRIIDPADVSAIGPEQRQPPKS